MPKPPKLGSLKATILEGIKTSPNGLTMPEIRELLGAEQGQQEHINRRVRELRSHYEIPLLDGRYVFKGERAVPADASGISGKLRAAVLHKAHGRCQMCGMTVAEDGVKLEADHKVPRNWGGETTEDNLWAICQACNNGKRDFFSSLDDDVMIKLVKLESVYERIAEMLRLHDGEPVPSWLLEFVANFDDFQEDWQKRLRELRYPVIGMKIKATRAKTPSGKWQAAYLLEHWVPLPPNHKTLIKEYERNKKKMSEED
jgi:hypothetical protein